MRMRLSNGLALGYGVRGAGRPLIFLHPIGTRRTLWNGVIAHLQNEMCCVCVDFRGHGESDVPGRPFSLDDLVDDVVELMHVRAMTNVVVVECSMGGMVAQGVAGKVPELLSGLVLAGTSHAQTAQSTQAILRRSEDALKGMPSVMQSTIERWFPEAFRAAQPHTVEEVRNWLLDDDPVVFSWGWRAIAQFDNTESLRKAKMPALLVRGSLDASTAEERMRAMQALLPGSTYVEMPGTGHLAPMEQPEAFASVLRNFINQRVGRG